MARPAPLAEVWRGEFLESRHRGHLVVAHADQGVILEWGEADRVVLPRSSAKMIQALPLIESGAAHAAALTSEHLALACASHQGAAIHTSRVSAWLADLGLGDADLRCGPQPPSDVDEAKRLTCSDTPPCQWHNNCSGKHTGFLTLSKHFGGGPEYLEMDHPVQHAVREAFEDVTGQPARGWAIDGCSAPNFACALADLAGAMARFAAATGGDARSNAMVALREAMMAHPDLVAGETRACTELMRAMQGRAAIKTGAEGVYVGIVPERRIGIALKVADGTTRAAECTIAAVLIALGVLDPDHPATRKRHRAPITNWRGLTTGRLDPAADLADALTAL